MPLAQKILNSKKPFVLFHTYSVTKNVLQKAIYEGRSMDLDVCIDDSGEAYLGHSKEYHDKSGDPWKENMPIWDAVGMIADSDIPVIVDCKHFDAWQFTEEAVNKIGAEKCLVHAYASELKFDYGRGIDEPDFLSEWSPIEKLKIIKSKFPSVSTCVSCRWLPDDLLLSDEYSGVLKQIKRTLKENEIDTLCLNIPNETYSDRSIQLFLEEGIIPHIGIDHIDATKLSRIYIGETDHLSRASFSSFLKS